MLYFQHNSVCLSLKIKFAIANGEDPDKIFQFMNFQCTKS